MSAREKIRSLILTEDAEFRMKSIAMLNNIAFAAEKFVVHTMHEALTTLTNDPAIGNLIIDASSLTVAHALVIDERAKAFFREKKGLHVLIYTATGQGGAITESELVKMATFKLVELPIDRKHFMDVFHTRRSTPIIQRAKPKVDPEVRMTAQDAAAHLKSVVEQVNQIAADPSRLEMLADVGQRYNGIMGTFAFFPNVAGATELAQVGTVVDSIARTYPKPPGRLTPEHFELLVACCKVTLPLIRTIALAEPVPEVTTRLMSWILTSYGVDKSLVKRQAIAQTAIDQAMAKRDQGMEEMRKACIEASAHLKSAIEQLNVVFKDHARIDAMTAAGQRFNGMFGTFSFYRAQIGSNALIELSTVVDDLCRSYVGGGAPTAVADDHVTLLRDTAETCFIVLKDLREGRQMQDQHRVKAEELVIKAKADKRIKKRESMGQDDIDALLTDLAAA